MINGTIVLYEWLLKSNFLVKLNKQCALVRTKQITYVWRLVKAHKLVIFLLKERDKVKWTEKMAINFTR